LIMDSSYTPQSNSTSKDVVQETSSDNNPFHSLVRTTPDLVKTTAQSDEIKVVQAR